MLACGLTDTTNLLANKIKGRWNRLFDKADAELETAANTTTSSGHLQLPQ